MSRAWRNWSGLVRCRPQAIHRPATLDELGALVRRTAERGGRLRVAGSGHSFVPLVANDDTIVALDRLRLAPGDAAPEVLDVDRELGQATLMAGSKIHTLGRPLHDSGLALANQGDIHAQALAGAISTGTHGTGRDLGSLSTQVAGLTLVTASGERLDCSAEENADVFRVARLGLGCLGVLARVRLQLVPAYKLREIKRNMPLEECLAGLTEAAERYRHYELFWFPHTDRAGTKALEPTDDAVDASPLRYAVSDLLLENGVWWFFCQGCRFFPGLTAPVARLAARFLGEGERIDWSYRIFPNPRLVRFHEMEYAVPVDAGPDCLREIRDFIACEKIAVHYPLEYRLVAADDIPLSPFFERPSAVISVHMYQAMPFERYFSGVEEIFRAYDGRPHWGKMHTLGAAELRRLYPAWDEFHAIRRRLDPNGVFMNDYLLSVFEQPA